MKYIKNIITILIINTPLLAYTNSKSCDGNSYEVNQCLKQKILTYDNKLNNTKYKNIKSFKKFSHEQCLSISSKYKNGTFQPIKYGSCIISLDKWLLKQLKK